MKDLKGKTAVVTGASRGLGPYIARALAGEGMHLVLAARSASELEDVAASLRAGGAQAIAVPANVAAAADREALVAAAGREFGAVDVLVNNAGIERTYPYHLIDPVDIEHIIAVNLTAPMLLTRSVLPGMLERRRGHVVNVSSIAGKVGPPYNEPYAATKAGLIGFTESLRAECHGTGVSASVVCPGFVAEAGMFETSRREHPVQLPRLLGATTPAAVARAVVRVIKRDLPEALVSPGFPRALMTLADRSISFDTFVACSGAYDVFRVGAEARAREEGRLA